MKISKHVLAGALSAAALFGAANATIVELQMTSAVRAINHSEAYPYINAGDIATLTVRYDTEAGTSSAFGSGTLYKNAITYFSFSLERSGVETYSGSVSGNFGQIDVANNVGAGGAYDNMTFRIFNDNVDYPSGTRNGTVPAGDLPLRVTGDAYLGDMLFRDFAMHFTMIDNTVIDSEALPTAADLAVPGGGSPFGPRIGNNPWSGYWEFVNYTTTGCCAGSFGAGTPRAGDIDNFVISYSVRDYTGGDVSEVPVPAALPLFGFGLAGLGAALRRRTRKANA